MKTKDKSQLLTASRTLEIRFSEVDSMNIAWHGSYAHYLEDARRAFGEKYGIDHATIAANGYQAPLVELNIRYKKPILFGMKPRIDIWYRPTLSARLTYDYEIRDTADGTLLTTAHSVQVFTDLNHKLAWNNPPFFEAWKRRWGIEED